MRRFQYGAAMALCLSACACGPHGKDAATAVVAPQTGPASSGRPEKWEMVAGARWARPGLWSPVAEGASRTPIDIVSDDALGARVVRLDHAGGYDVWQARILCDAKSVVVSEGIHIDTQGHHLQPLPTSIVRMDRASVASFCSPSVRRQGGLGVADQLLPRPQTPSRAATAPSKGVVVQPASPAPPRIDAAAIRRMQSERQDALPKGR